MTERIVTRLIVVVAAVAAVGVGCLILVAQDHPQYVGDEYPNADRVANLKRGTVWPINYDEYGELFG